MTSTPASLPPRSQPPVEISSRAATRSAAAKVRIDFTSEQPALGLDLLSAPAQLGQRFVG